MIVSAVIGTNGAGKTALIRHLAGLAKTQGRKTAVIVNEQGEETFDQEFTVGSQCTVEGLRGGCVGCSLSSHVIGMLKDFQKKLDPDLVFIEPSEMVVTERLRAVFQMGLRDLHYDIGPLIVLVDATSFQMNWEERQATLLKHIRDADLVVVSRVDQVSSEELDQTIQALKAHHDRITSLSLKRREGLAEIEALYAQG